MKRSLLFVFLLCMVGCAPDHISERKWFGSLYQLSDDGQEPSFSDENKLSDVYFRLEGKTLTIFSNAIFGSENDTLQLKRHRGENYLFKSSTDREFDMRISHMFDESTNTEHLTIMGADYVIKLFPVSDSEWSDDMLAFYIPVPAPPVAEYCFNGCWKGEITRLKDDRILSPVVLNYNGEVLNVYANAIFGKANEILHYRGFYDECFWYTNDVGEDFYWAPEILEDNHVIFTSDDFRMTLSRCDVQLLDQAISFYRGRNVVRNADGYMFGTYTGKISMRAVDANTYGILAGQGNGMYDMEVTCTITFLEDNRCRTKVVTRFLNQELNLWMSLLGGGPGISTEEHSYRVEGNKLIIGKDDEYIIRPDGCLYQRSDVTEKSNGKIIVNDIVLRRVQ